LKLSFEDKELSPDFKAGILADCGEMIHHPIIVLDDGFLSKPDIKWRKRARSDTPKLSFASALLIYNF
jgi:hypothetical protein